MRAYFLTAVLLAVLGSQASAQIAVGPVAIENEVNGVPITVSATSWVTVDFENNELVVNARIFADLIDLQKKFAQVVGTFKLPQDSCPKGPAGNPHPVVFVRTGSLWPRGDQLVMFVRGHVDMWSCVAGPSKSGIQWKPKKIGFIKMKVPVLHTWTNVRKNKNDTQPFDASLPISLVQTGDETVALELAKSDMNLGGRYTNAILKLAKMDINRKAYNALQSAIDPTKLKAALPKELQKFNMSVVSARFRDYGGHAIAEINLAARVSGTPTADLMQNINAGPRN